MELLDRYVKEVGKHLSGKNRADIETELRSTLQDMLEDRSQKTGRPLDDRMVLDVLKSYGDPKAVAATYQPEHYLIGPKLYPLFLLVLKIVAIVLSVMTAIEIGTGLGTGSIAGAGAAAAIGKILLDFLQGLMAAFGNIVFVFAVLDRVLPDERVKLEEPWDPAVLMKEPDADTVRLWEPVIAILGSFAALVVLNFYPQIIAINFNPFTNDAASIPLLSAAFFTYLPWINLILVLTILLNVVLLRLGHQNNWTRSGDIIIKAIGLFLALAMLRGPSLVGLTAQTLQAWRMDPAAASTLASLFNQIFIVALVITVIADAVDIAKDVYHMVLRSDKPATLRFQ